MVSLGFFNNSAEYLDSIRLIKLCGGSLKGIDTLEKKKLSANLMGALTSIEGFGK